MNSDEKKDVDAGNRNAQFAFFSNLKMSKELFWYANKAQEQKGSMVWTPDGYGVLQTKISDNSEVEVRFPQRGEVKTYPARDLLFDVNLNLKLIKDRSIVG